MSAINYRLNCKINPLYFKRSSHSMSDIFSLQSVDNEVLKVTSNVNRAFGNVEFMFYILKFIKWCCKAKIYCHVSPWTMIY